jgi:putative hemolysin
MKKILLMLCIISVLMVAGCTSSTQIANPASKNCIDKGGTLKILEGLGGQYGMCTLANGTECEEWAYFRDECPAKCGECPLIMPPSPDFCAEGKIVDGGKDSCGCQLAPKCEAVACTEEAKICPDGSAVGRVGPDCEFAACPEPEKHFCTPEQKKANICTMVYMPVCGWFDKSIQCFKYPCAQTHGNSCEACVDPKVEYWTEGECPK